MESAGGGVGRGARAPWCRLARRGIPVPEVRPALHGDGWLLQRVPTPANMYRLSRAPLCLAAWLPGCVAGCLGSCLPGCSPRPAPAVWLAGCIAGSHTVFTEQICPDDEDLSDRVRPIVDAGSFQQQFYVSPPLSLCVMPLIWQVIC